MNAEQLGGHTLRNPRRHARQVRRKGTMPAPCRDRSARGAGDYDRAFGLVDDPVGGLVDGMSTDESSDGLTDGEVA